MDKLAELSSALNDLSESIDRLAEKMNEMNKYFLTESDPQ